MHTGDPQARLRADCSRCAALCCVAPALTASADFAIDKPAGQPCPNLGTGLGCTVHHELRDIGFPGCAAFDCFGAGQQVVQVTFAGRGDWRGDPALAAEIFATYRTVLGLHELLWHLMCAQRQASAQPAATEVAALITETEALAGSDAATLAEVDTVAHQQRVDVVLRAVSAQVRGDRPGADLRHADLAGRDLRGTDLRRADLRGALLLGTDLRHADLRWADVIGADLRGADLRGADLSESLFLTRTQVGSARGDSATRLPDGLDRPAHWR